MKRIILAGSTALALALAPSIAFAQDDMADDGMAMDDGMEDAAMDMTAEQMAMYEGWPDAQQTMFDEWPANIQTYYWTLNADQQRGWWALSNEQRTRLFAMAPAQRTAAWTSIMEQINAQAAAPMPAAPATTASSASTSAAAPAAATKEYPICGGEIQDSCIQPRAAGKNYGNRPLDYWPGEPASELKKKKAAK